MSNINNIKEKQIPINILFNQQTSQYNVFYSDTHHNTILSYNLANDLVNQDSLIVMNRRFKTIKFLGLPSLIDFCKSEKLLTLQIVLEWINFFIYKVSLYNFYYSY